MTILSIAQKNIARRTAKKSIISSEPPAAIYWADLSEVEKRILIANRKLKAIMTDRSYRDYIALWARFGIKLKNDRAFNEIRECLLDQGLNPFAVWLYEKGFRAKYKDGRSGQGWYNLAGVDIE